MSADRLVVALVRRLSWPLIRSHVTRRLVGVSGLENLPASGGVVVAPNHRSYYDHFVMLTLLRRLRPGQAIWFVTKAEAFTSAPSRIWHESWDSIPVDRAGPSPSTVRTIRDRLAAGEVVCIYPEGTRNPGSELLEFRDGAFRFADLAGAPVLPVAMAGTEAVMPRGVGPFGAYLRRGRVRVAFGVPLVATATGRRARTEELLEATRTSIESLSERLATDDFAASAAAATAEATDRAVTGSLDASGRLGDDGVRRHARTLRVAQDSGTRGVDLTVQLIRLEGLAATNREGPARVAAVLPLGPRLRRVVRAHPDHFLAHYLLGRWQLLVPGAAGGGPARARRTLGTAARLAGPGDTRALSGVAEACTALGDQVGLRQALQQIVDTTFPEGRGAARIERARIALSRMSSTPVRPEHGPPITEGAA